MLLKSFTRHFVSRVVLITAIQIVFVVAKLVGILKLSWLWVFAPLLIAGTVLAIALCVVALLIRITGD